MDYRERDSEQQKESDAPTATAADIAEKTISRTTLINRLNFINFQDGEVLINFVHPKFDLTVTVKAVPQPCTGGYLVCRWSDLGRMETILETYRFHNLVITNGRKMIAMEAQPRGITRKGICLPVPESAIETNVRKINRYACDDVTVQLLQNGVSYSGGLVDFSANSFKLHLSAEPMKTFQWINPKTKVNVIIQNGQGHLYSGECRITRQTVEGTDGTFILEPLQQVIQRYKPKEYRSRRFQLTPSPDMIFSHPFTHKRTTLKVLDLAGSGFSVQDDRNNPVLIAGMVIPDLELNFANSLTIHAKAQVVYRKTVSGEGGAMEGIKCGLAFLDIHFDDHLKLLALLHQVENRNAYVCNQVDMDDLWRFFFDTGFIYPKKYVFLRPEKENIKDAYQKLYIRNPGIARHFIYQENGVIRGHMSMLRFYEKTWLIHHHAARSTSLLRAGLVVLDQVGQFTFESHRLHSSHMDYLMCYFRPDNQFPQHVFGGAARHIKDPDGCSLDLFTYGHFRKTKKPWPDLPSPWKLDKTTRDDLLELDCFYRSVSGGLMIRGLDLTPGLGDRHDLSEAYHQAGLKRERRLFSLKYQNQLRAVIIANITDVALNLSDLTSCLTAIVMDGQNVPREILLSAVARLAELYRQNRIPLLLYPVRFAEEQSIPYEKQYCLWLLNTDYSDQYFQFIEELNKLRSSQT
ncbi:MAG: PilZ domain-containing protein [Thermodesulfobacteriota bacterium]